MALWQVSCPVLLLQGDPSRGGDLQDSDVQQALSLLADGLHVRLEDTGHDLGLGAPDATPLLNAITGFLQNNVFNHSRISTVVVCVITSNLRRARMPGNVLLDEGEGNLPKQSVVNVSQIYTVNKLDLLDRMGTLEQERVREILDGVHLLIEPRDLAPR